MTCSAQYEPYARRQWTHTCDLEDGHDERHHCPLCGSQWDRPGGRVEAPTGSPASS